MRVRGVEAVARWLDGWRRVPSPEERLMAHIFGRGPLHRIDDALSSALERGLARNGIDIEVDPGFHWPMRYKALSEIWKPFLNFDHWWMERRRYRLPGRK
jgi:hypothetical protein